ncbi:MAG: glycosyltransferase, partial [Thermoplasmata archaeon]
MDIRIIPFPKWVNFFKFLPYRAFAGLKYGIAFYFYKFKEHYDYIIANYPPSEWISTRNKNVVWYCHSPLRDAYDLYEYRQKNRMNIDKFYFKILITIFKFVDKLAVHRIKTIIANSQNVQKRIKKYFNRESVVIYPAVDAEKYKNNGDGKYFLYVSRFVPNKRQEYVIK